MSPRSRIVVLLVLSVIACGHGQSTDAPTEKSTEAPAEVTTEAPTTTTTAAPAPGPAEPTSDPTKDPAQGSWNVTVGERTCIQSQMGIRIGFTYTDKDNATQTVSYDVPANGTDTNTTGSSCGASATDNEVLAIGFFTNNEWKVTLTFQYGTPTEDSWVVRNVDVQFVMSPEYFPGVSETQTYTVSLSNQTLFQTSNGSSYQCVSEATLQGFSGANNPPTVNVTTAKLRVEAFRIEKDAGEFSAAIPCPADTEVSNIVPIAVGAALAALVVIVLIAYLIGRKKNKRGYESV